jgi:AmmeMemoRadiSam system protein B
MVPETPNPRYNPAVHAHRRHWLIFLGGVALGGAGLGLALFWTPGSVDPWVPIIPNLNPWKQTTTATSTNPIRIETPAPDLVNAAFDAKRSIKLARGTRVLLLPHHLIAARDIASLVDAAEKPSVIYLIAPDHFSQGRTTLTTTDESLAYGDETTRYVPTLVSDLLADVPELRSDFKPFIKEHGVTGLVPFFTKAWGDVPIIPIIVRIDASKEAQQQLGIALADRLKKDKRALLVSSVDFSHYQPAFVADFHDILAEDVITSLADLETEKIELDSPGALAATLKAARELGLGNVTIQSHTNSLRILQAKIAQDSTSHFTASFAPGAIQSQDVSTMLFIGDIMLDRTVRDRIAASKDPFYTFKKIRGQEDRFFHGQDTVIANLEGPVTPTRRPPDKTIDFAFDPSVVATLKSIGIDAVSQANNHQLDQGRDGADESRRLLTEGGVTVFGDQVRDDAASSLAIIDQRGKKTAIAGFNVTDNPLDRDAATKTLADARSRADHVVVFIHWGEEYRSTSTAAQKELAHWLIDHGANAVIGAHPHWVEGIEVYNGRPIAYSLGNFIFDQDWSTETRQGLVAGLAFFPDKTELHLFPISINLSQPQLLTGEDRDKRLKYLSSISDSSLDKMIQGGIVTTIPTH